ncbi:MAG: hypothetical protein HYX68_28190 [Planctomycetes bacterium]|nr:hypothetical protein [Planctomycetota bacterium]
MLEKGRWVFLALGLAAGVAGMTFFRAPPQAVWAANDRHDDYIMATGLVGLGGNKVADGIWLLDYRAGKLLGTVVDPNFGKILPWAEVDLVKEFNIPPKQNVHFLMTTGATIQGPTGPIKHTALYLTEINTGRFGVYTMIPILNGSNRMMIRRHDLSVFRRPANP